MTSTQSPGERRPRGGGATSIGQQIRASGSPTRRSPSPSRSPWRRPCEGRRRVTVRGARWDAAGALRRRREEDVEQGPDADDDGADEEREEAQPGLDVEGAVADADAVAPEAEERAQRREERHEARDNAHGLLAVPVVVRLAPEAPRSKNTHKKASGSAARRAAGGRSRSSGPSSRRRRSRSGRSPGLRPCSRRSPRPRPRTQRGRRSRRLSTWCPRPWCCLCTS